jgi:hypothetical protein
LFAALGVNERDRDPQVLRIAAELLEHYGATGAPVLLRLAQSENPACQYFVKTIINLEVVSGGWKREALTALAKHPDVATRKELLEETDRASADDAIFACRQLTSDSEKHVRQAAREKLAFLEA